MRKLVEKGEVTEAKYRDWRIITMMTGKKWNKFLESVAKAIYELNIETVDDINDSMADVYVDNYNYVGKDIEAQVHEV